MLLRNPPRRFVRPVGRTAKLLGMVQVVCASSECPSCFACSACCALIARCSSVVFLILLATGQRKGFAMDFVHAARLCAFLCLQAAQLLPSTSAAPPCLQSA